MLRRFLIVVLISSLATLALTRIADRELPRLESDVERGVIGAFHIHTESSHDSSLDLDTLTRTAKSAGLDFVIVTDHNNQLGGPLERNGVLVVSGAEVSTPFGHLIQLGADRVPERGHRGGLDIHSRLRANGAIPILAHPTDPKRPWTGPLEGVGGIEVVNLSTAARQSGGPIFLGLLPSLIAYRLNPPLAIAQLYSRDARALRRWDAESDPRVVGLCGVDAHGRFIDLGLNLRSWVLVVDATLVGNPEERATALIEHIAAGRFYCATGLLGQRPRFRFVGRKRGDLIAATGETVTTEAVSELEATAPRSMGETATIVLLRNGEEVARTQDAHLRYPQPGPGTYRIEIRMPIPGVLFGYDVVPVIYSNRIRVERLPSVASTTDVESE